MRTSKTDTILQRLPSFYTRGDSTVLVPFVDIFGQVFENAESDLLAVMNAHWVDKANNEGSQGFDSPQKGDLDQIFSLYLENLGGTSQLKQLQRAGSKDDDLYRARIEGLIQVLLHGASTVNGILSIVAANLGIMEGPDATPDQVQAARSQIRIVEFLPDALAQTSYQVAPYESFTISNTNPTDTAPQIRVRILSANPLSKVTLVMTPSGASVGYAGEVSEGDLLSFFSDGSVLLNGVPVTATGTIPKAPFGLSSWHVEVLMRSNEGVPRFLPVGRMDVSTFDQPALFNFDAPVVEVDVSLAKLTPGFFTVIVPWDIPGFTEKFDHLPDNPRNQIGYIVNKVKAAGIGSAIVFQKLFPESHEMADSFSGAAVRNPLSEDQGLDELGLKMGSIQFPYPQGIDQGLDDSLILSGAFDRTGFDTLNTFA